MRVATKCNIAITTNHHQWSKVHGAVNRVATCDSAAKIKSIGEMKYVLMKFHMFEIYIPFCMH